MELAAEGVELIWISADEVLARELVVLPARDREDVLLRNSAMRAPCVCKPRQLSSARQQDETHLCSRIQRVSQLCEEVLSAGALGRRDVRA